MNLVIKKSKGIEYYCAQWTGPDGRQRTRSLGRKTPGSHKTITKTVAQRLLRDLERDLDARPDLIAGKQAPRLSGWLDIYDQQRSDWKQTTRTDFQVARKHLMQYFTHDPRIDRITRAHAAAFRAHLAEQGMTEQTARKYIRAYKTCFRHAEDQDLIRSNPFSRIKSAPIQHEADFIHVSLADLQRIMDACPNDAWRCLFALCRLAGLRRGEALRLQWNDIDWDQHMIHIMPEGGIEGTKQRRRTVPIVPQLHDILLAHFAHADRPADVSTHNLVREAERIIKRAGLAYGKPFHNLRKACASDWLAQFPVMYVTQWLGHSPTVARKHYAQTPPDILAAVTNQANFRKTTANQANNAEGMDAANAVQ